MDFPPPSVFVIGSTSAGRVPCYTHRPRVMSDTRRRTLEPAVSSRRHRRHLMGSLKFTISLPSPKSHVHTLWVLTQVLTMIYRDFTGFNHQTHMGTICDLIIQTQTCWCCSRALGPFLVDSQLAQAKINQILLTSDNIGGKCQHFRIKSILIFWHSVQWWGMLFPSDPYWLLLLLQ